MKNNQDKRDTLLRLWGRIEDSLGMPVCDTPIEIFKVVSANNKEEKTSIGFIHTNEDGYYDTVVFKEKDTEYKIALHEKQNQTNLNSTTNISDKKSEQILPNTNFQRTNPDEFLFNSRNTYYENFSNIDYSCDNKPYFQI